MVTEGVRQADGTVRARDGSIDDQGQAGEGLVDPSDLDVHLTWHDGRFPMWPDNDPPLFTPLCQLVFEDVAIVWLDGLRIRDLTVP
jgi:hypothetical protein